MTGVATASLCVTFRGQIKKDCPFSTKLRRVSSKGKFIPNVIN
jgi:hypothetical protein